MENENILAYRADDSEYSYESLQDLKEEYDDIPEDFKTLYDVYGEGSWADEKGLIFTSYKLEPTYENAFFTIKACQAHIDSNRHHYNKPDNYISFAFRNPEMKTMVQLFKELKT